MKRIVGVRPTGKLHIGHYFSVIEPAITLDNVTVLIADHHTPQSQDTAPIIRQMQSWLLRLGGNCDCIDIGSKSFDYQRFTRLLHEVTVSRLRRMPQYKDATEGTLNEAVPAHTLLYPLMMAVDLVGYDEVIIGHDQQAHIDFARDVLRLSIIERYPEHGGRIMDLRKPLKKMSKSSPEGCLFLDDDADTIRKKLRKAVSCHIGVTNLSDLYLALGGEEGDINREKARELKDEIADRVIERLGAR